MLKLHRQQVRQSFTILYMHARLASDLVEISSERLKRKLSGGSNASGPTNGSCSFYATRARTTWQGSARSASSELLGPFNENGCESEAGASETMSKWRILELACSLSTRSV